MESKLLKLFTHTAFYPLAHIKRNTKLLNFPFFKRNVLIFFCSVFFIFFDAQAQNPIVLENLQTGNPSSEWDISGAGDLSIQGFSTDISVNQGQTIYFKIKSPVSYTIDIYRLGWYGGNGARKVSTLNPVLFDATLPQSQPTDDYDVATGMTSCSNWAISAHWDVPVNAVSGIYIAKLTRTDTNGSSHIVFVVRSDNGNSDLLFKTSDTTWQAYNGYGGNSLYVNNSGIAVPGYNHATKVSYDRPFITRNGGGGGGASEDWVFNAEYPMIRWLERNGYDVSYTTDVDLERRVDEFTTSEHKVLMSVGHDEYWSANERLHFEKARNNGVHLAFFSGNEVYWKVRWEDNNRTLVCYKEGNAGENTCGSKCDNSTNIWTGTWRDGNAAQYPGSDGGKPENELTGQISWDGSTSAIVVPDSYKNLRFWRNTSIATLASGLSATLPDETLGYEWDWEQEAYASSYPNGRITLSNTNVSGHVHKLSLYRHSSGALVFGAGTVQWSWGLDNNHDRGNNPVSLDMQQATINLFADMGVQPESIQTGTLALESTDITPPLSVITQPDSGSNFTSGSTVLISGTATDVDGEVAGIEISLDGGATWKVTTGSYSWTYNWVPTASGSITILSRGFDDSGNMETPGLGTDITIDDSGLIVCPCSIWPSNPIPTVENENDPTAVELGMKFQSAEPGYITGIRFYKGASNIGTHTGNLWTTAGVNLGSVIFTGESASGWQVANFTSPVAIDANTTYIVSYHTTSGYYSANVNFFNSPVVNNPLTALMDSGSEPNGVYKYGSSGSFPNESYQATNYWVDVVFETTVGPDVTAPQITTVSPAINAIAVNKNTTVVAIFNEAIDPSTINSNTFELRNASNSLVNGTVAYTVSTRTATFTPTTALNYTEIYTVILKAGDIKDLAGNSLTTDYTWSFTTQDIPPPPPTDGPGGPILLISNATNPFSRYPVEILRAEGLNEFSAMDITQVDTSVLNNYDIVVLGEMSLSASNVTMLTDWVNSGGILITFKPDLQLASLLGISSAGGTLSDKYLLIDTASNSGVGLVNQTIQFHGTADYYNLNGATALATLYSDATTATTFPAVTINSVGGNGGKAIAFTYDLAKSIVYTRQGNPAWANQKRDGQIDPIRSDDQFFPDWIDFNKIAIPQADEQQHLLSNIILKENLHKKPLPKIWFLPKGLKAAVVMTGDDHGDTGMQPRFDINIAESTPGCSVEDWDCIRSTGYLYVGSTFTNAQAIEYNNQGFEIALHVNTNCQNFNETQYQNFISDQMNTFQSTFPGIPLPVSNRNHCIAWSGWSLTPEVESANGIRFDTNYYYWPASWVLDRPGMFTGSGLPMRFAKLDGTIVDCYQAVTQMPDESGESFPAFVNVLLDNAIGPKGYYGVFTTNMHFDTPNHPSANAIVASAKSRGIPVVTSKQMLNWLDGRNNSSFNAIQWTNNQLSFGITAATYSRNMKGMVPVQSSTGTLNSMTYNGSPLAYTSETIKGIQYAFFDATLGNGTYIADYGVDTTPPVITNVLVVPNNDGTATISWETDEPADSRIDYGTSSDALSLTNSDGVLTTSHSIVINNLSPATLYYFRLTSVDASANSISEPVSPATQSFTMPQNSCVSDSSVSDFNLGSTDANTLVVSDDDGAVSLKPAINEEFTTTAIPSNWTDAIWDAQAGAITTFSAGQVTVNGTHLSYNTPVSAGTSLEFTATFTTGNFQNIGFTADTDFNAPWVVIGRGAAGDNNVYARTSDNQSVLLGSTLLNSPHRYRIEWLATTNNFQFYVDGILIATPSIVLTVNSNMIIQISDYPAGGEGLTVDSISASPYSTPGTFISKIFDAGSETNWGIVNWNADVPDNTTLQIAVRKGNTAIPDGTWSPFVPVTNGEAVSCGATRYIQYKADFTNSSSSVSAQLNDISISCGVESSDSVPPVIANVVVVPNLDGTTLLTWNTDEAASSVVDYGLATNSLNLNSNNPSLNVSHSIVLSGLTAGETYFYKISSTDCSGNTAYANVASFSIPIQETACFQDQSVSDFSAGSQDSTYVTMNADGEVTLKPAASTEFSILPLTTEWNNFDWGSGGTSTVNEGVLTVNGARFNSDISLPFNPETAMEFKATFGATPFQHIGFGGGNDSTTSNGIYNGQNAWAMFSTGNGTSLLARTSLDGNTSADFLIPGTFTNAPHVYRIDWKASSVDYYVDGTLVHSEPLTIAGTMRPAISDYNSAAPGISVDWIYLTPYETSGTFISRIYDAGSSKDWEAASWAEDVPTGTTLQLSQRQSASAISILSEPWTPIISNGSNIGGTSQFIQYKADFTTSNTNLTSVLKDISFSCSSSTTSIPDITIQPISQSVCNGETVSFVSEASGNPAPTIQWQISLDGGGSWSDIFLATNSTYTFATGLADNGKQFKAIWTNAQGSVTSDIVTLLVNSLPTASIVAMNNPICEGDSVSLQFSAGSGLSPFTIVVNGKTYNDVVDGETFATINTTEQSIWGNSGTPVNPSVTDNQSIEVGTKFRSSISGYITGIRFYKGVSNTGLHTANLWTTTGVLLATANFTAETASGWQEVRFSAPVAIEANTTYIGSYFSQDGYFAISSGFFASSGVTNGSITALQEGIDGPNGVYKYGGGFPDGGNNANYWVDVLFAEVNPSSLVFDLTKVVDANGCFSEGIPLSTVTVIHNPEPKGVITPFVASVCEGNNVDLIFNASAGNAPFSLVINGTTYPNITDGTPFTVATATYSTTPITIFSPTAVGGSQTADNAPTELGIKFNSSVSGTISGIRFYKTGTDVVNFTASLWDVGNVSTPLATANYISDNTIGWKEIIFASPIPVTANTSYIASYFSPESNYYAYTANALSTPIVNAPLTAESSFFKQPGPGYPDNNSTANYWVDVIFNANSSTSNFNLTSIISADDCSTTGNPISTASVAVNSFPNPTFISSVEANSCTNTDITYTTQSGQSNYNWTITGTLGLDYTVTSGGLTTADNSVTLKWLTEGIKTITVNYSDSTNCLGETAAFSTTTVTAINTPTVNLSASLSGIICEGTSVIFTATADGIGDGTVNYDFKINGISVQNSATNFYNYSIINNNDEVSCDINVLGSICTTGINASSNIITISADTLFPTASNPADIILVGCNGSFPAPDVNMVIDEADNCLVPTVAFVGDSNPTLVGCEETIIRTYSVTDANSNTINVAQNLIRTIDSDLPTASNPADIILVGCNGTFPAPDVNVVLDEVDNCSTPTVAFVGDGVPSINGCIETTIRTYSVTDACGNTINVTQNLIRTLDTDLPTASNPADIILVGCNGSFPAPDSSVVNASDNCSTPTVAFVGDSNPNINGCIETIIRTYSVTDACGNTINVAQNLIRTIDSDLPTASNPADIVLMGCNGSFPAPDVNVVLDEADNCSTPTVAFVGDSNPTLVGCVETIIRTYSVTDACGNTINVAQNLIRTLDTDLPTASNPADIILVGCNGTFPVPDVNMVLDEADNCSTPTVAFVGDGVPSINGCIETTIRTYSVTDACGNMINVSQNLIRTLDSDLPNASNPADIILVGCNGSFPAPDSSVVNASDNCSTPTVAFVGDSAANINGCIETIIRTYSVTDACGNTINVAQNLIRTSDTDLPTASNPADIILVGCNGTFPAPDSSVVNASDNCSTPTVAFVGDSAPSINGCIETIIRTYSVTDACGNTINVSQNLIRTIDTDLPTASNPSDIILVGCNGSFPAPDSSVVNASDNCSTPTVAFVGDSVASINGCIETTIRTYSVTDACGNTINVAQNLIRTIDTDLPTASNPADIILMGCNGSFPAPDSSVVNASDNCSTPTVAFVGDRNPTLVGCVETIIRTYSVTDACGNTINVAQNLIRTIDTDLPTASNPADIILVGCNGTFPAPDVNVVLDEADNCLAPTVAFVDDSVPSINGCIETIIRTYSVTDACGNTINVAQNLIRTLDTDLPTASNPADIILVGCNGSFPAPDVNVVLDEADNCSTPTVAFVGDGLPIINGCIETIIRTYSVTDACGNTINVAQNLIRTIDSDLPTASNPADIILVGCNGSFPAPDNSIVNASDNCSTPTVAFVGDSAANINGCIETIIRTYSVTDACGNAINVSQNLIRTIDSDLPTASNPADIILMGCNGTFPAPDSSVVNASDNCSTPTVVFVADGVPSISGCIETTIRTYSVTDACGNTINVSQNLMRTIDSDLPTASNPSDIILVGCNVSFPAPDSSVVNASDNCSTPTVAFVGDSAPNINGCIETIIRTYSVTDACGNTINVSQNLIRTLDSDLPTASNLADIILVGCNGSFPAPDSSVVNASDNCSTPTVAFVGDSVPSINGCIETIIRTYSVTDACGNTINVSQNLIRTLDTDLPTASNPADIILVGCNGSFPAPDSSVVNASDNCSTPTVAFVGDSAPSINGCIETTIRTYSVTDACGNTINVAQNLIRTIDTDLPTASNPSDIILVGCNGTFPAPDSSVVNASDNCSTPTVAFVGDGVPSINGCIETTIRTYSVTDACGNTINVAQNLIRTIDRDLPTASNPADIILVGCNGSFPAPDVNVVLDEADNCSTPTVAFVGDSVPSINGCIETIIRTYSVTDACGNAINVSQNLIRTIDSDLPTASNPSDIILVGCNGSFPAPDSSVVNASDNCSTPTVAFVGDGVPSINGCIETTIRTYSVTDACGNTINVAQNLIRTLDSDLPTASNPADIILVGCNGTFPAPDVNVVLDEADNCLVPTVAFVGDSNPTLVGCEETIIRTYSVTDACGNTINVAQNLIRTIDTDLPTASNPADIILVGCNGSFPAPDSSVVNASDNCSTPTVAFVGDGVPSISGCIETTIRTYSVTDACGNTINVSQNLIRTLDSDLPTASNPADIILVGCNGSFPVPDVNVVLDEADNCSTPTVAFVGDSVPSINGCIETTIRTYSVTDACGNTINVTQNLIRTIDSDLPTASNPADIILVGCNGSFPAPDSSVVNASDNCSTPTVAFVGDGAASINGCIETIIRTYSVTDACGNIINVNQNLIRTIDSDLPTASNPADIILVGCNGSFPAPDSSVVTNASDNCSTLTVAFVGDSVPSINGCIETTIRTYSVTDACGNTINVAQNLIRTLDTDLPTASNPADIILVGCNGSFPAPDVNVVLDEADNCSTPTVAFVGDSVPSINGCIETTIRTYSVTDACGNTINVSQNLIRTIDSDLPTASNPADIILVGCNGSFPAPDSSVVNASDNCSTPTVVFVADGVPSINGCIETTIRTYSVTDACGNTINVSQNLIRTIDTDLPTASNPADIILVGCNGSFPVLDVNVVLDEADNCSTPTVAFVSDSVPSINGCVETTIRTYSVTDACGNTINVAQNLIRTIDTDLPTASNPADIILVGCNGTFPAPDSSVVNASDNCSTPTVVFVADGVPSISGCIETTIRTYSVTDACGNTINVSQNLIRTIDSDLPTASNPSDIILVGCNVSFPAPDSSVVNASDNCSTATVAFVDDSVPSINGCIETIIRTYSVTDACGNTINVAQNLIRTIDSDLPTASNPADIILVGCNGTFPAPDVNVVLDEADNCSTPTVAFVGDSNPTLVGCVETIIRTYSVTDACGNTMNVSQNLIRTIDSDLPTASNPADIILVGCNGTFPAPDVNVVLDEADNCSTPTVAFVGDSNPTLVGCVETIIRTYSVTDACGNTMNVSQNLIRTIDKSSPVFVEVLPEREIQVNCDQIPTAVILTAIDNCNGNVPVSFTENIINVTNESYSIVRKWNAKDVCGNVANYIQIVNVNIVTTVVPITVPDFINSVNGIPVDLAIYLPQDVPKNGIWVDVKNSGALSSSILDPNGVVSGDYSFQYNIETETCPISYVINLKIENSFVLGCGTIKVHNAFTPNEDGFNDKFIIDNIDDVLCYPENTVEIYNRWGILVYKIRNYNNSSNVFDGSSNVKKSYNLPIGTYFYILNYNSYDGNGQIITTNKAGYLYLTR